MFKTCLLICSLYSYLFVTVFNHNVSVVLTDWITLSHRSVFCFILYSPSIWLEMLIVLIVLINFHSHSQLSVMGNISGRMNYAFAHILIRFLLHYSSITAIKSFLLLWMDDTSKRLFLHHRPKHPLVRLSLVNVWCSYFINHCWQYY